MANFYLMSPSDIYLVSPAMLTIHHHIKNLVIQKHTRTCPCHTNVIDHRTHLVIYKSVNSELLQYYPFLTRPWRLRSIDVKF